MSQWVMRHPRVLVDEPTCYGASEVPVDPDHLHACAHALAELLPAQCQVFTSERQRTQAVARCLQAQRPDLPAWQVDARLNEMDFGVWEMTPWRLIPKHTIDAWTSDFAHHCFGGKESVAHLLARTRAAWQACTLHQQRTGQPFVWISHAGTIKALQFLHRAPATTWPQAHEWPDTPVAFGQILQWPSTLLNETD